MDDKNLLRRSKTFDYTAVLLPLMLTLLAPPLYAVELIKVIEKVKPSTVYGIINMVFVKGTKEAALSQPSGITYAIPGKYLQNLLREQQLSN